MYWYEIEVTHHGKHLLRTDRSSGGSIESASMLFDILRRRFPTTEGFKVSVTKMVSYGEDVTDEFSRGKEKPTVALETPATHAKRTGAHPDVARLLYNREQHQSPYLTTSPTISIKA